MMRITHGPWLVACLCAEWCGTCREYRGVFEEASRAADGVRFAWIDVENFPTLLIARPGVVAFFGTVTPHASTLASLVERAMRGDLSPITSPAVEALAERVRAASRI